MEILSLKQIIKLVLGRSFSPLDSAILVNSYGRSGSTMLTKSIIASALYNKSNGFCKLMSRAMNQQAWDIDSTKIRPGFIYKTHDYPPKVQINKKCAVIYVFANPVNVVISLIKILESLESDAWMREHFDHLKSEYAEDFYSIIDCDTLNLEPHFNSWLAEDRLPVAFVRYEKLWENQDKLSAFLGMPLQLPPYRERKAQHDPDSDVVARLETTYSSLKEKVYSCNDFFTINC